MVVVAALAAGDPKWRRRMWEGSKNSKDAICKILRNLSKCWREVEKNSKEIETKIADDPLSGFRQDPVTWQRGVAKGGNEGEVHEQERSDADEDRQRGVDTANAPPWDVYSNLRRA
jgi:hypothetical protein